MHFINSKSTWIKIEGVIPAPEAIHAIAAVVKLAEKAKEEGKPKTILLNLCTHGHFDTIAYEAYFSDMLTNHYLTEEVLTASLEEFETLSVNL